jgi:two-component system alkaline phosphatase synthesis response regulator PhoP
MACRTSLHRSLVGGWRRWLVLLRLNLASLFEHSSHTLNCLPDTRLVVRVGRGRRGIRRLCIWDVCREIRQAGLATPILFLTARTHTIDKIAGLKLGADDYVTKPFEAAELMARIQALLRRTPAQNGQDVHQFGSILVDLQRGEVTRDGRSVHLATREFELLRYLIERTGTPVSREELLAAVWGPTSMSRVVRTHIARLREKLEADPKCPELIVTVEGMGYKFAGSRNW